MSRHLRPGGGDICVGREVRRVEAERQLDLRYRDLAARAAAPLSGLWPPGWFGENLEQPPLRVRDLLGNAT